MGDFGGATAEAYQFTRAAQDAYAMETLSRARKAVESGAFKNEIVPITVKEKAGLRVIENDEHPLKVDPAKIPGLKPAFRPNGTITPAASSANADGAAALILTKRSLAGRDGLSYLAEIKGHATHSQEPQWFTTAPIPAIRKLLDKVGWSVGDVDLFEINEAFAVVAMAAQRDLGIPREKLNINGGACALGHPREFAQQRARLARIDDLLDPEPFGRTERRAQLVETVLDLLQLGFRIICGIDVGAIGRLNAAFQRQRTPIGRRPGIAQREPVRRLVHDTSDTEGIAHDDGAPGNGGLVDGGHGAHAVADGCRLLGIEPDHEARTIHQIDHRQMEGFGEIGKPHHLLAGFRRP